MPRAKQRAALLSDANYFAGELIRCLEGLVDVERSHRALMNWQQAAAVVRRIRGVVRFRADELRRFENRKAREMAA